MATAFVRCSVRNLYWRASQDFHQVPTTHRCRLAKEEPQQRPTIRELFITPRLSQILTVATEVLQLN